MWTAAAGDPHELYPHSTRAHSSPACHVRALIKTGRELMLNDGELLLSDAGPAAGEARRQAHEGGQEHEEEPRRLRLHALALDACSRRGQPAIETPPDGLDQSEKQKR
jgi:hypothetical protein